MVAIDFERAGRGITRGSVWRSVTAQGLGGVPPTALVLAGIVSVQVGAALAKQLFSVTGAGGAVTLRLVFAGVVLLLAWRSSLRVERGALPVVLGYGAVLALMNLSFYAAIDRIPLGMAVTIEFLGPLTVALAGSRRWIDPVWAVLAGAGVLLLTRADGDVDWVGVLFALAAAACWAGYILLSAALGERTVGGGGLALAMAFGGVIMLPVGILDAGTALLQPAVLAAGFAVAMLSSVLPYSVELEALRRISPRVFGVLMSLEPAVAAVAGLVVLGQVMNLGQWAGVACVVAASAGATRTDAKN
ncbi:EamA family transporter [Nocardia sp. NBC_00508]|uniref:EamA family transporter n=1 Tax=Nocardia sp. NBC_00508 TaxID=2975992 RepID=UPI002E80821A|nr:EamA family transporter [Nocardia sp. NBC_00508]WUD64645.1 EamA family transporter [Nocardia sp. NBC_00508]